jgi:hypothetical protein
MWSFGCVRCKVEIQQQRLLVHGRQTMRSKTLAALAATTFAIASTAFAADPVPTNQFKSLDKIVAVPMSQADLSSVRGEHVHFLDAGGGKLQFAGTSNDHDGDGTPNNWQNLGGSDNQPVAPSYHGLCVAQSVGVGGISIPGAAVQC